MATHKTYTSGVVYYPTVIDAVAITTTSAAQNAAGSKAIGIDFFSANETVGVTPTMDRVGTLTIEVSMDGGTTWREYSMLIENSENSNVQGLIRVASKQISTAVENHLYWMTPETLGGITHVRAKLTRDTAGTGGTFSVKFVITY
jgi:hypothetical protein